MDSSVSYPSPTPKIYQDNHGITIWHPRHYRPLEWGYSLIVMADSFAPKGREPSIDAQRVSRDLVARIAEEIAAEGGWIPFSRYMDLVLHYPGLGYYGGGARKFGVDGDFVTAPEITPLFGSSVARQVAQIFIESAPVLLEVGAGSGRLAADLLIALSRLDCVPQQYLILELSGELRARQRTLLAESVPDYFDRIVWLDDFPATFSGCVLANELLDAMPVDILVWQANALYERGVIYGRNGFEWAERPAATALIEAAAELPVADPFVAEIGLVARAWVSEWGRRLERGALLLIDYGLPRHELYHPGRTGGTVRCHYRHTSHDDPFWWPGLSDITAHVDFTAIAEAGYRAGLELMGYTSQANFLMNCGIGDDLVQKRNIDQLGSIRSVGAVQTLISPQEMGELFKVIALGKGISTQLLGFDRGDRSHTL